MNTESITCLSVMWTPWVEHWYLTIAKGRWTTVGGFLVRCKVCNAAWSLCLSSVLPSSVRCVDCYMAVKICIDLLMLTSTVDVGAILHHPGEQHSSVSLSLSEMRSGRMLALVLVSTRWRINTSCHLTFALRL